MGDLIKTQYSDVTATLEVLDRFGVTSNGLKNLRTMSPILGRQIAHLIEHCPLGMDKDAPPALDVFNVALDSTNPPKLYEALTNSSCNMSSLIAEMVELSKDLPVERRMFVILNLGEFHQNRRWPLHQDLCSDRWLSEWSRRNLLGGFEITTCARPDTAVHVAKTLGKMGIHKYRSIMVYTKRFNGKKGAVVGTCACIPPSYMYIGTAEISASALFELIRP